MNYNEIINKMGLHKRFTSEQSLPFKVNDYICWFDYEFEILEDYLCDVYVDNVYLLKNDDVTIKEVELVYRHKIVDEYIKSEEDFYLFLYNELNNTKNIQSFNSDKCFEMIEKSVFTGFIKIYKEVEKTIKLLDD